MKKAIIGKVIVNLALLTSLTIGVLVGICPQARLVAQAQQDCRKIGDYSVCGRFLQEWSRQGSDQNSIFVNGLPIAGRHAEVSMDDGKTYDTQWFERARYEAHPENTAPYDVLLGRLGVNLAEGRGAVDPQSHAAKDPADQAFVGVDKPTDADGKTKTYFSQTRHSISGKILDYWVKYGGLAQFGYPLSEQFAEISPTDGKTYQVQYFERNRIELHPEKQVPYDVELGLLGVQQYKLQPVPAAQLAIAPAPYTASSRDTAYIGLSQEPASLEGWAQNSEVTQAVLEALDNGLVAQDYAGNYFAEDAYYVPTIENGGSYYVGSGDDRHLVTKYKLRHGIKWSDGQELTANDAAFAYKLMIDPNTTVMDRTIWQKVASVEVPGKYTVVYNWLSYRQAAAQAANTPGGTAPQYLQAYLSQHAPVTDPNYVAVGTILPQHVLGKLGPDTIGFSPYAHEGHVGTGPFRIERWVPTQELDLVQNENYTLTDPALLKRIVVRFVSDPNQLTGLLKSGALDGATSDAFSLPSPTLDQLAASQTVEYVPGTRWERVDFDMQSPITSDRAVREAIITGINRQKIVDDALMGKGTVLNTVIPPGSWASLQNSTTANKLAGKYTLPLYTYNPAKANSILDADGWVKGPDGIRTKSGQRLQLTYVMSGSNAQRQVAANDIQSDLKAVGIDVQLQKASAPCADCTGQPCQLCAYASALGAYPDLSEWDSAAAAADASAKGGVLTYKRYSNSDLDPLIRQFSIEIDRAKEEATAAQIQVKLMQDIATVPLFVRPNIEVHKATFTNWHTSSGNITSFYNVAQWYFK